MTASGSTLTGGTNAVYSTAGIFSETYTVDPWGNQQESGNFNFLQSYNPATNRINGYSYDAAGDLLGDGMNTYAYDGEDAGEKAAANVPGGCNSSNSWIDASGNLWLFGGTGATVPLQYGEFNDLWRYTP
jgi:hypothetical protein